jgi:hemolysin D
MRIVNPVARTQMLDAADTIATIWSGDVVLITRRLDGAGADPETFGFSWFLPSIWRYRRPLVHLLVASFFIQLFALVTPLFFQIVVDKVLVHRGGSTLVVIVIGLVLIGLFDVILQYLRSYALARTTSRIDVELGSRLFDHLLRLPLAYFETRAAGQTVAAAGRDQQARDLESTNAEAARRRVAIAASRDGAKDAPAVAYPDGTSEEVRERENGILASEVAQLASSRASLMAQRAERIATRERLRGSIAARERLLALNKEYVSMLETLNQTKAASRGQVIEKLQQYETQLTAQIGDQGQLGEVEAALLTIDRKLEETVSQFIADQTEKLGEAERRADHLKAELVKATARHERTRLTAPISGTVQQLAVTTVGQVVTSGQALMTIVPSDGPIEIEAMIQNQDIGFVEPGQPAVVKIESFPFTRFGTVDGAVLKVSRDAVDEREQSALADPKATSRPLTSTSSTSQLATGQNLVFPATISLAKRFIVVDGKEIPLTPGMAVTVEIRTGQRRALDYVLSPLREVTSNAGHER